MRILKSCTLVCFIFLLSLYSFFVFILPPIINIPFVQNVLLSNVLSNYELNSDISNLNIKISPILTFHIKSDEILIKRNEDKILNLKGLYASISPFKFNNNKIIADEVYLKLSPHSKNRKNKFDILKNISYYPNIKINKMVLECCFYKVLKAEFSDFSYKKGNISELSFNLSANIDENNNKISVLNRDKIYFTSDKIFTDKLNLYFNDSKIRLSGVFYSKDGSNFNILGKNIETKTFVDSFILINRCFKGKKHFIENFKNFNGVCDIDLDIKKLSAFGEIKFKDLSAETILLSVPLSFKEAIFKFKNDTVVMKTEGNLGLENVYWNFFLTGLFTDNLVISGKVASNVSDNFAKTYIDKLRIKNKLQLRVDYFIQNKVVNVVYNATLPVGSDILYYGAHLGLKDFDRNFQVITKKDKDIIKLVDYTYAVRKNNKITDIITGYGEFEKINNKYILTCLFGETMNNAPVSLLGFLDGRLRGGFFNGNLLYDFKENKLSGSIVLEDTKFNGFYIKEGAIFADDKNINILSLGDFRNEPFTCEIILKNELKDKLLIEKLDLYLKKFVMNNQVNAPIKNNPKFKFPVYNRDIDAKEITFKLGAFKRDNFILQDIVLNGSVKNNLFNFKMPDIYFADGTLSAKGFLNFDNKNSNITFLAKNINSNIASYQLYNLYNQIYGSANAKLFISTKNLFKDINGYGEFKINEGYLPKIGSTEFALKSSKKSSKLSDIIKIKDSLKINPKSNITGNFKFDNFFLKDIKLYLQNEALSMFIEGNYNADNSYVDLNLYGKYDADVARNIYIWHIPISFLTKIFFKTADFATVCTEKFKKTPDIKAKKEKTKRFEIVLKGNINDKKSMEKALLRYK